MTILTVLNKCELQNAEMRHLLRGPKVFATTVFGNIMAGAIGDWDVTGGTGMTYFWGRKMQKHYVEGSSQLDPHAEQHDATWLLVSKVYVLSRAFVGARRLSL